MTKERTQWSNKAQFYLSTIGYSVGVGNINRFPYILFENGGGTFLIPYFIFLFFSGASLFLAETALGQYTRISVIGTWNFAPISKGIGWSMIFVSAFCCVYYIILISWALFYLGMSFSWDLPWGRCSNFWNTPYCYSFTEMIENNQTFSEMISTRNMSSFMDNSSSRWKSSAEEFYLFRTLNISSSINNIESINTNILICFIICWVATYLCLVKGAKSIGKIVYGTATFPYLLLTVLCIQGALLPGSMNGIKFYLLPDWKLLLSVKIWVTAASQIFFSLGPGWGGLIMMASYNQFHENLIKTSIIIPIVCCLTSFYGGFAIFSIIGHMSYITNITNMAEIIDSGPGLAFVAYPQALSLLPGGAILSVLFFFMVFIMGLGTMFGTFQTMIQGLADEFPILRGRNYYLFTAGLTVIMIIFGLPFTTRAGCYFYQILDWYSTPFAVLLICICESTIIPTCYNMKTMIRHIEQMVGTKMPKILKYWFIGSLAVFTPIVLIIIFIISTIYFGEPKFNNEQKYPRWAIILGWSMGMSCILPIPVVMIKQIIVHRSNLRNLFKPNAKFIRLVKERIDNAMLSLNTEEEMKRL